MKVIPLMRKMIENAQRCNYGSFLSRFCPLNMDIVDDSNIIDEENVTCCSSKASYASLIAKFSSFIQVSGFLKAICDQLIPHTMWGSIDNISRFHSNIFNFFRKP